MQNKGIWIGLGVFLAIILAGFFLLRKPASQTTLKEAPTPTGTEESNPSEVTTSVREIVVVGSEYSYNPKNIQVEKGEKIKLVFRNIGAIAHNLVVADLGISTKTIAKGEEDSVEFTASEGGTFSFFCSIAGHKALGMEGEIEVK